MNGEEMSFARRLVLEYGWNSTCYQVLNPGIERWISKDGSALVGYVRSGKTAIVAGAPICHKDRLSSAFEEWTTYAKAEGLEVCYFGSGERLQSLVADLANYTLVTLGYDPEWRPSQFIERTTSNASLRAQLNRAKNKGVEVVEWEATVAENHPELLAVLQEWLDDRGLPPMHFLVEPDTLQNLVDRRIFVGTRQGQVVGFVTLCPIPARNGWLTEQFVRSSSAPNGTVELMLFEAIQTIASEGYDFVTMGLVPLVQRGDTVALRGPGWLSLCRKWAYLHLSRFYNFRGLDAFKTKFSPEHWHPVVAIVSDRQFRFRHLRSIARAFTRVSPELALVLGLHKAVRSELRNLWAWITHLRAPKN